MLIDSSRLQIIIPVYQPDEKLHALLQGIKLQSIKNIPLLLIDSGSDKVYLQDTADMKNVTIKDIDKKDFNHGLTRQMGIDMFPDKDIYIFFTQDAIPANEKTVEDLIKAFADEKVGCAYGRQLPNSDATIFAKFARLYNYGPDSYIRSYNDRRKYGVKTVFISNSFAAYRKKAMDEIGGFAEVPLSEDMYAAAKMLLSGYSIAYRADAMVYHSHNLKILQECRRYREIGEFNRDNRWIQDKFGKAEGSGVKFVQAEMKYIAKRKPSSLINAFVRDAMKYVMYKV